MESLRPDREDLDQFKSRNKKTSKSAPIKTKQHVVKPSGDKSRLTSLLTVALIVLSGLFAWTYHMQQGQLLVMQEELKGASDFIGRSKLLMARFEGELNVTGTEMEQSGSAVQSKLAFLDGEMRKLWAVSNERNKKAIKKNLNALSQLQQEIASAKQWRKKFETLSEAARLKQSGALSGLSLQASVLQGESEKLDDRVQALSGEIVMMRNKQNESLKKIKQSDTLIASLSKQLADSKKAISSINASRLQLNDRVVGMERQINKLQLSVNN